MDEPTLQTYQTLINQFDLSLLTKDTSFLDLLNFDSPVLEKLTQTVTNPSTDIISATDNIQSTDIIPSTNISHPLIIPTQLDLSSVNGYSFTN